MCHLYTSLLLCRQLYLTLVSLIRWTYHDNTCGTSPVSTSLWVTKSVSGNTRTGFLTYKRIKFSVYNCMYVYIVALSPCVQFNHTGHRWPVQVQRIVRHNADWDIVRRLGEWDSSSEDTWRFRRLWRVSQHDWKGVSLRQFCAHAVV